MFVVLIDYIAVMGATLAGLFALEFILRPARGHIVAAAFFGCVTLYLAIAALETVITAAPYPDLFFLVSLIAYTGAGPLGWLYVRLLFDLEFAPARSAPYVLLPPVLIGAGTAVALVFARQMIGVDIFDLLAWTSFAINMLFFGRVGVDLARLRPAAANRGLWMQTLVLLGLVLGVVALDVFGSYAAGMVATSALVMYGRVLKLVRPGLHSDLEAEGVRHKYRKSKLTGQDPEALKTQLERLLTEERLFAREGLSLTDTAGALDLTPHQLSELINLHYGQSFKSFLNGYRVAAAHEMLLEERERDVTDIAYSAGFQSLSSFYRVFKEIEGISPNELRKRAG